MSKQSGTTAATVNLDGFNTADLKKSVVGLSSFLSKRDSNDLLETRGKTVTLTINLAKIPPSISSKPLSIDIPFPLYFRPDTRICIFVRDPQKKWKERISEVWKVDDLNGLDLPKVIGLSKLKANYPTMAAKRSLCRSYDIFLCDTRIVDQMPRILGRTFITAGKLPHEVPIKESNLLEPILHRLRQTFLSIRTGPSLSVKVGFGHDAPKELYRNALSAIQAVSAYFVPELPEDEEETRITTATLLRVNEIMSIYLTATDSPALPIFIHPTLRQAVQAAAKTQGALQQSESEAETAEPSQKEKVNKRRRVHH